MPYSGGAFLFAKLDVLSRTEAITVASRRGLVQL
jgi:DNA-binding NarL/FixJ family response regulator